MNNYSTNCINSAIKLLHDAIDESTDKQEVRDEIIKRLNKEFGFDITDIEPMYFR